MYKDIFPKIAKTFKIGIHFVTYVSFITYVNHVCRITYTLLFPIKKYILNNWVNITLMIYVLFSGIRLNCIKQNFMTELYVKISLHIFGSCIRFPWTLNSKTNQVNSSHSIKRMVICLISTWILLVIFVNLKDCKYTIICVNWELESNFIFAFKTICFIKLVPSHCVFENWLHKIEFNCLRKLVSIHLCIWKHVQISLSSQLSILLGKNIIYILIDIEKYTLNREKWKKEKVLCKHKIPVTCFEWS